MLNAHIGRTKKLASEYKKWTDVRIEHSKSKDKKKGDIYDSVF